MNERIRRITIIDQTVGIRGYSDHDGCNIDEQYILCLIEVKLALEAAEVNCLLPTQVRLPSMEKLMAGMSYFCTLGTH